jgi:hypothetical protein
MLLHYPSKPETKGHKVVKYRGAVTFRLCATHPPPPPLPMQAMFGYRGSNPQDD